MSICSGSEQIDHMESRKHQYCSKQGTKTLTISTCNTPSTEVIIMNLSSCKLTFGDFSLLGIGLIGLYVYIYIYIHI